MDISTIISFENFNEVDAKLSSIRKELQDIQHNTKEVARPFHKGLKKIFEYLGTGFYANKKYSIRFYDGVRVCVYKRILKSPRYWITRDSYTREFEMFTDKLVMIVTSAIIDIRDEKHYDPQEILEFLAEFKYAGLKKVVEAEEEVYKNIDKLEQAKFIIDASGFADIV